MVLGAKIAASTAKESLKHLASSMAMATSQSNADPLGLNMHLILGFAKRTRGPSGGKGGLAAQPKLASNGGTMSLEEACKILNVDNKASLEDVHSV